ncbi:MAG: 2-methylcitrate dehydratase [Planctomycetes bacterium SCN 63-9]|nr:MAG: 2-methylcitrate dehydratase [Planctomycetes bacterium SCN 63-9]
MSETMADRLAAFALSTRFEDLSEGVVVEAKRRLLDSLACAVGALHEPSSSIARNVASKVQGTPSVHLIGGGTSAPDWAAFANGVHIRYLDCNDTYLSLEPAHPSDNWAAVMAAGESVGASGKDWIIAAAIAYEVQCRLCDAASIRANGWDHTTYGSLSTSLAVSKLLGLGHEATVHALGIAGTTGTALRLNRAGELSMWKGCAFAFAARNGVFAASLAAEGMTGPAPLFEGEMGFWEQVSGPFKLEKLGGKTTDDWMLPKTSIKFVPAEYHSQSAIAAAFELRPEIGDPKDIKKIEIATFRTAVEIIAKDPEKWKPKTRETADHSLPYCTVVALVDGDVSAAQFTDERLSDPSLLDLVARTTVVEDPRLTAGYPDGIPNRLTITLNDGRELVREISYPPGHDKNPLTDEQLSIKFHKLIDPVLGRARGDAIWNRVSRLETDPNPHEVLTLLDLG